MGLNAAEIVKVEHADRKLRGNVHKRTTLSAWKPEEKDSGGK